MDEVFTERSDSCGGPAQGGMNDRNKGQGTHRISPGSRRPDITYRHFHAKNRAGNEILLLVSLV